jgi:WD40 repeat protein
MNRNTITMASAPPSGPRSVHIAALAEFKPPASSRAWASVPNPNGLPLLATATSDKAVRVYSLLNFTLHSTIEGGHSRSVRSVTWKPEVRRANNSTKTVCLVSGSFDATMGIWRLKEGFGGRTGSSQQDTYHSDREDGADALEVEIRRNDTGDAGNLDETSENADDWDFAIVLEGHDSEIKHVAFSPSGQWLASCSRDKSIWVWEEVGNEGEDEWETIAVLQEHTADVKCICWREDDGNGEVLASASYDDTIRLWKDIDEGEWGCFAVLEGHEGTVWDLQWEPEVSQQLFRTESTTDKDDPPRITQRLMSSSADTTIRVWTLQPAPPPPNKPSYFNPGIPSTMRPAPATETWECTATLPKVHDLPVYSIDWSKKTGRVVSAAGDGRVAVYEEMTKGRSAVGGAIETEWIVLGVLTGGHGPYEINNVTWCTRFDPGRRQENEEMIVTTGDDGSVRAWSITEG